MCTNTVCFDLIIKDYSYENVDRTIIHYSHTESVNSKYKSRNQNCESRVVKIMKNEQSDQKPLQ